jgi:hypothetical protein
MCVFYFLLCLVFSAAKAGDNFAQLGENIATVYSNSTLGYPVLIVIRPTGETGHVSVVCNNETRCSIDCDCNMGGATTLGITALGITTPSIRTLRIMSLRLLSFSTDSKMTFNVLTLSIKKLKIMILSILTLNSTPSKIIMTLSITTFSIKATSMTILGIIILSKSTHYNGTQ